MTGTEARQGHTHARRRAVGRLCHLLPLDLGASALDDARIAILVDKVAIGLLDALADVVGGIPRLSKLRTHGQLRVLLELRL